MKGVLFPLLYSFLIKAPRGYPAQSREFAAVEKPERRLSMDVTRLTMMKLLLGAGSPIETVVRTYLVSF